MYIRIAFILIAVAVLYMGYRIVKSTDRKIEFQQGILSEDFIKLYSVNDSTLFQFQKSGCTILAYFNSECEYCQEEFTEIEKNKDRFSNVEMVFFSSESIRQIISFAAQHGLSSQRNMYFTKVNPQDLTAVFGSPIMPTFFIYKNKKLIRELRGKRKIEEILTHTKTP